ncbi:hypothetical protein [Geminicoccus roseus]|uniref:hypothetical protein n=1 Tax=Geminicoccus roseus TaxID=404900 RepID=UPI0012F93678|nr:hypothetical protein [Geminicoccus roseus]
MPELDFAISGHPFLEVLDDEPQHSDPWAAMDPEISCRSVRRRGWTSSRRRSELLGIDDQHDSLIPAPDHDVRQNFRLRTSSAAVEEIRRNFKFHTPRHVFFSYVHKEVLDAYSKHLLDSIHSALVDVTPKKAASPVLEQWERALLDLQSLSDDWAGPGTTPPSDHAKADVEALRLLLAQAQTAPEFEVDESDGQITLRWVDAAMERSFALVVPGNKTVIAVGSAGTGLSPRVQTLAVDDEAALQALLEQPSVAALINP